MKILHKNTGTVLYEVTGDDLREANFSGANFSEADLSWANLSNTDLYEANLSGADLAEANLVEANFSGANLSGANLSGANLSWANLSGANLSWADLIGADLSNTNLTGATGLLSAREFLKQFERTDAGVIVFKRIGSTDYKPNPNWKIQQGEFLTETVNSLRTNVCGCGVNFGTRKFIDGYPGDALWECLIEYSDLADVVVPYNTDGKARCARLKLLRKIG